MFGLAQTKVKVAASEHPALEQVGLAGSIENIDI
jgi:hypothetical protein